MENLNFSSFPFCILYFVFSSLFLSLIAPQFFQNYEYLMLHIILSLWVLADNSFVLLFQLFHFVFIL